MAEVVRGAVASAARFAASNHVVLRVMVNAPARIDGDARWLEQAIVAVIDNAVKFSSDGADVDISAHLTDGAAVVVKIADRGRGVSPEELPRIFDAYYQTEAGRMRGGNGLGLALSRWIVEQHGGQVRACQRAGGGCQVGLRLPSAA